MILNFRIIFLSILLLVSFSPAFGKYTATPVEWYYISESANGSVLEVGRFQERREVDYYHEDFNATLTNQMHNIRVYTVLDGIYYEEREVIDRLLQQTRTIIERTARAVECTKAPASNDCTLIYGALNIGPFDLNGDNGSALLSTGFASQPVADRMNVVCHVLYSKSDCSADLSATWYDYLGRLLDNSPTPNHQFNEAEFSSAIFDNHPIVEMRVFEDDYVEYFIQQQNAGESITAKFYKNGAEKVCFEEAMAGDYYTSSCKLGNDSEGTKSSGDSEEDKQTTNIIFGCSASEFGGPNYLILILGALGIAFYAYRRNTFNKENR